LANNQKNKKLRILVLGYIVRGPMGGMTWHHLQYFLGLYQMGHDVFFLEDSGDTIYSCYDPVRNVTDQNPSFGLDYASKVFKKAGLENRWGYYDHHRQQWRGPLADTALKIIRDADLLLNLSCSNPLRSWFGDVPVRVLIDTDPVFTQIRNIEDPERLHFSRQHTAFFSFGENFKQKDCLIPDDGISWKPTRQPVVLDAWPVTRGKKDAAFTTIMKWESYPGKEYNDQHYGMKAESFNSFMDLPEKTSSRMELAVSDSSTPRKKLIENGWQLTSPQRVSSDPWQYQEYIHQSKAEFSIAKHGYVVAGTGWFSERSACYLASGRPVVLQDTGFSTWLKTGFGLIAFDDMHDALSAIEEVNNNYNKHCRYARELAESYFSSDQILTALIERSIE
jgi:hypothetical protein